jgi:hypothetical protein
LRGGPTGGCLAVRPGSREWNFSAAAINGPVEKMRRLASEEERDPSQLDTILRIYPTATGSVEQVIEAVVGAEKEATVDHAFVDLMEIAKDFDHALEIVKRVLERSRGH